MAATDSFYVNSLDQPGKVFQVSFYKPAGRPARVTASEGTVETRTGYSMFTNLPFSCRSFTIELPGRATKKAIAAAFVTLLDEMEGKGVIAAGSKIPAV
jgi:hypothetical protein